jgi:hypothetical protein
MADTSASRLVNILQQNGFFCINSRAKSWRLWNYYQAADGNGTKVFWTNILCGHKTVAQWVGGKDWRHQLFDDYCQKQLTNVPQHIMTWDDCGGVKAPSAG